MSRRPASRRMLGTAAFLTATLLAVVPVASSAQPAGAGGSPAAASDLVSACIGCHSIPGYQTTFPRVYRVPMIAGQQARYIEASLIAYKRGDRSHPTMTAIARGLTDAQIRDIAAHYAALGAGTP